MHWLWCLCGRVHDQDNVDAVFPIVVPALASQLVASRSGAVAASTVLDSLSVQTSKPHLLAAAYVAALQQHRGNVRIQAAVVEKLAGAWCLLCVFVVLTAYLLVLALTLVP